MIPDVITVESYINCIMLAVLNGHLQIVKFLLEDCRLDAHEALKLSSSKQAASHSKNVDNEAFCLFLCLAEQQLAVFEYLFLSRSYAFDKDHLLACLRLCETLSRDKFVALLVDSKTSHEIFNAQSLDGKLEIVKFLLAEDRTYADRYAKSVKKAPYNWAYCVIKANDVNKLDDDEVEEVAEVANKVKDHEIEIPDGKETPEKIDRVGSFIKKLAKLDEDEDKFQAFRTITQKVLANPKYSKYKAEDDEKLLTEISEGEGDAQAEAEEDNEESEEEDDDEYTFPTGEEF